MPVLVPDDRSFVRTVRESIQGGSVRVLSLDIFDTVLWRRTARPVDVFVMLGAQLAAESKLAPHVTAELFGTARATAERAARNAKVAAGGYPEVTLEQIYDMMPAFLAPQMRRDELVDAEVEIERRTTVVDRDVAALAAEAAAAGLQVVAVSDTYFSEAQLLRLLDRKSLAGFRFDRIFVSNAHETSKADTLFSVVLSQLGVSSSDIVHVGDHEFGDGERPSTEYGIRCVRVPTPDDRLKTVLQREGSLVTGDLADANVDREIHLTDGDFGLTGLRLRGRRSQDRPAAQLGSFFDLGLDVFGPVFGGFGDWIHDMAATLGVRNVYCLMREGEFLADLIRRTGRGRADAVTPHELWVSRDVVERAGLLEANEAELWAQLVRRQPPTMREFLRSLGLETGRFPEFAGMFGSRLDAPDLARRLIERILEDPSAQAAVIDRSATLRRRLIALTDATIVDPSEPFVVIDVGWGATIQRGLTKIAHASGRPVPFGLYLQTNSVAAQRAIDGIETVGFLGNGGFPREHTAALTRSPEIVEQLTMSTLGSLVDIDRDNQPVQGRNIVPAEQVVQRDAVRAGVWAFLDLRDDYRVAEDEIEWSLSGAVPALRRCMNRLVADPLPAEAALFATWQHDDNFGTDDGTAIIDAESADNLRYLPIGETHRLLAARSFWPEGLAATQQVELGALLAAVDRGEVRADTLARKSGEDNRTEIFAASDDGIFHPFSAASVPVVVNHLGLSFARLSVSLPRLKGLRIDPVSRAAVMRIDRIVVRFSRHGEAEPIVVRFDTPEAMAQWRTVNAERIGGSVFAAVNDDPQLILDEDHIPDGHLYKAEVELAFAVMELPGFGSELQLARHDEATESWSSVARRVTRRIVRELDK